MNKILYSKNYDLFKIIEGTRISNSNLILRDEKIDPILVNKDMYIIDGVHRFIGLKNNNLEIPYIIKD